MTLAAAAIAGLVGLFVMQPMHKRGVLMLRDLNARHPEVFDAKGQAAVDAIKAHPELTDGPELIERARMLGWACIAVVLYAIWDILK